MPTYKLFYFNITGLAEPVRFIMHQCGVKFEDERFSFDDWHKYKPSMPLGQVPVLEIDGKKYHQSKAICRYFAKKHDLCGSNEIETLQTDATADTIDDMRAAMSSYYWEKDPAVKAKLKEVAFTKLAFTRDKLEEQVKNNGGHFVAGKLTWPDLMYTAFQDYFAIIVGEDFNKNHPELKKLVEKVKALPNIKAYLEKRPKTDF